MYGTNLSVCVEHLNRYSYIQVTIFSKIDRCFLYRYIGMYIYLWIKRGMVFIHTCVTQNSNYFFVGLGKLTFASYKFLECFPILLFKMHETSLFY